MMATTGSSRTFSIYKSMKKVEYVCKNDIPLCFQVMVFKEFAVLKDEPAKSRVEKFFKHQEKLLQGTCNFILKSDLAPIKSEFLQYFRTHLHAEPQWKNIEKKMLAFMSKMGKTTSNASNAELQAMEELYRGQRQSKKDAEVICEVVLKSLEEVIRNHPKIFRPANQPSRIVRMFVDENKEKFVMVEELEHALNGTPYTQDPLKTWKTMDGKSALAMALSKSADVEFLQIPISLTKPATVILSPTGTTCRFAVHVLLGFFEAMYFDFELFDISKMDKANNKSGEVFEKYFPIPEKSPLFIDEETSNTFFEEAKKHLYTFPKLRTSDPKYELMMKIRRNRDAVKDEMVAEALALGPMTEFVHNQKACHSLHKKVCCGKDGEVLEAEIKDVQEDTSTKEELEESDEQSEESEKETMPVPEEKAIKKKQRKGCRVSDVAPEPPKPVKESSTCQKCFRTSNLCNKVKVQLKESKNSNKQLEKKLSEAEKELEALKEQMEELMERNEQLEVENQQLKEQNSKLTVQSTPAQVKKDHIIIKERSLEVKQKFIEFQDKLGEFRAFDPIGKAAQEIRQLTTLTKIQTVRDHAEYELLVFKEKSKKYEDALEKNIELIQSNISTSISDLLPVPEYPVLPEVFYMELKKAQDQDRKNKELENECIICTEPMDKQTEDELFQCPECNKKVHLPCISQWFERSNSCPCCRTQWT